MTTILEDCRTCVEIASGEREGICLIHGLMRLRDEEIKTFVKDAERRAQTVVKRYVVQAFQPKSETVGEEISERTYLQIQSMKDQLGAKSLDQVVQRLVTEMAFRYDPAKSLENRRPLIVVGPPESGKTRLVKSFLNRYDRVFVVDVSHEYDGYDTVNTGDVLGNVWSTKKKFRLFPADNPLYSDLEMSMTFGILLGKMKEPDSPLKDYVIVIEDAVRFTHVQSIRSFIAESRKFIRKCIVVCQDPRAFEGMGEILKP